MLNGKYDADFPYDTSQKPLFELLWTSPEKKHQFLYETGHFVPRNELIKETLNWLDKYFGPVNQLKTNNTCPASSQDTNTTSSSATVRKTTKATGG